MRTTLRVAFAGCIALACGAKFAAAQVTGDHAFGEYLSAECVTCHRVGGASQGIPSIAGLPAATFVQVLKEYRLKQRANPIMQTIAARLSDAEMAALAAYFGSLPGQR